MERMRDRVEQMERDEAKLNASADKRVRAPIFTRTRISSGFGKGMVRRDKWREGNAAHHAGGLCCGP